jgi:hypothetical protein
VPSLENCDCAGDEGPFDPWLAILASVDVLSRPAAQFVENTDGPNGPATLEYWLRCGIEPARSLDRSAALLAVFCSAMSPRFGEGLLKGLGEGVGRDVFATSDGKAPSPLLAPPGEKRDGTVPARARLVCGRLSGVGRCEKSGNPSVGDSGMFSRRGVELPLVGGPHTLTGRPSCAWISRALWKNVSDNW